MRKLVWDSERANHGKSYRKKIFVFFILILEHARVYLVSELRGPDNPQKRLSGFCQEFFTGAYEIYIKSDPWQGDSTLSTLIHELTHLLFVDIDEDEVKNAEKILMKKFSPKQKKILAEYIPQKISQ